jgi:excisionase family DNA binding protein
MTNDRFAGRSSARNRVHVHAEGSFRGNSVSATTGGPLPREYFTPAEVAQYLGFSTNTVQDLCRRGELRHVKMGRSIRIRKAWADAYMAMLEREPLQ